MCNLAHGGESRVTGRVKILNQKLDAVWDHAEYRQRQVIGTVTASSSQSRGDTFFSDAHQTPHCSLTCWMYPSPQSNWSSPPGLYLLSPLVSLPAGTQSTNTQHIKTKALFVWVHTFKCDFMCGLACCVVARQYSAVLRMLQIRQSSSTVNFAASEPSFSFSRLLMVRPPLLLLDLEGKKDVTGRKAQRGRDRGVNIKRGKCWHVSPLIRCSCCLVLALVKGHQFLSESWFKYGKIWNFCGCIWITDFCVPRV